MKNSLFQNASNGIALKRRPHDGSVTTPSGPCLPHDEWASLKKDDRVALRRDTGPVTAGSVDIVALDGSVFWVHLDHGCGRVVIHADDDVFVWREG